MFVIEPVDPLDPSTIHTRRLTQIELDVEEMKRMTESIKLHGPISGIVLKPTWKQRLYSSPDARVFIMGNRLVVGGPDGGVVYISSEASL